MPTAQAASISPGSVRPVFSVELCVDASWTLLTISHTLFHAESALDYMAVCASLCQVAVPLSLPHQQCEKALHFL